VSPRVADVLVTYCGSDGERTKALYSELESHGAIGFVASNLFRACKSSERAKLYRGGERGRGSYRRMAYDRKQWAMDNLCRALTQHAGSLGIVWGWGRDAAQPMHADVLYIELPTGQVSFHTAGRGEGPDYRGAWDGERGQSADRICRWVARLLAGTDDAMSEARA
jgi:hypothetical protein